MDGAARAINVSGTALTCRVKCAMVLDAYSSIYKSRQVESHQTVAMLWLYGVRTGRVVVVSSFLSPEDARRRMVYTL